MQRSRLVLDHLLRTKAPRGFPRGWSLATKVFPAPLASLRRSLDRVLTRGPDILLLLEETYCDDLRLERVAINRRPLADQMSNPSKAIVQGAPAAYFSPIPLEGARRAVQRAGIRLEISSRPNATQGNTAFFSLLHRLHQREEVDPLVVLLQIPMRNRTLSLQDVNKSVLTLLRYLAGASAARRPTRPSTPKRQSSSPAAGRKA